MFKRFQKQLFFCIAAFGIAVLPSISVVASPSDVVYPKSKFQQDVMSEYPLQLLQLAIDKSKASVSLTPSEKYLPEKRALYKLRNKDGVDVLWSLTSEQNEEDFLFVKIPLFKGLSGWRVALVSEEHQVPTEEIKSVEDLKQYTVIQGSDWPGRFIFEANKISVHHAYQEKSRFEMLCKKRGDMLFRSIVAAGSNKSMEEDYGVKVDANILVRYPSAIYFFVHKSNQELASYIKIGLEAAVEDGSFDQLFYKLVVPVIESSELNKRVILDIDNPFSPATMPTDDKRLWYQLSSQISPD